MPIAPTLGDIATNLVATALWELALCPTYRGIEGLFATPTVALHGRLAEAVAGAAATIAGAHTSAGIPAEAWRDFLASDATQELVLHVFTYQLANHANDDELKVALASQWRDFTEGRSASGSIDTGRVLDRLVSACQQVLDEAIENGVLEAHEAKSAARHRLVEDRLAAIERRIATPVSGTDTAEAERFISHLRSEMRQRHATIEPPSLQARQRVAIEEIYVEPQLDFRERFDRVPLPFDTFVTTVYRRVVLGSPGGGKSTLTFKLCHLLGDPSQPSKGQRDVAPWRIELRRYAAIPAGERPSLVEYFAHFASVSYSISCDAASFEYALDRGRLMVIFDGLDELLDPGDRVFVRDAVESFCRRFPRSPVLVTSRFTGYDSSPLDPAIFDLVTIREFDSDQVGEYARKWFRREPGLTPPEQKEKAESFVAESEGIDDIRSNPLLLALMCAFYRGRGYIPKNLPDVYGSCAQLLFETWDKARGIDPLLPFARHIRPALTDLAYFMFTEPRFSNGVTRSQAVERTAAFLRQYRFGDAGEAHAAAQEFIDFCRGRAWVFSDTGEMRHGQELFAFTHRTFLEYFCAEYLQLAAPTPARLVDLVVDRVGAAGWEIVIRIALQMKARTVLDGADAVVNQLGYHAERAPLARRIDVYGFVLRALGALVPSPPTVRALANSVLSTVAREALDKESTARSPREVLSADRPARELLYALTTVDVELASELRNAVSEALLRALEGAGAATRVASELSCRAAEVAANADKRAKEFWLEVGGRVVEEGAAAIASRAEGDLYIAMDGFSVGVLGAPAVIEHHGWEGLVSHRRLEVAGTGPCRSIASELLVWTFDTEHSRHADARTDLRELAGIIRTTSVPWIRSAKTVVQLRVDEPFAQLARHPARLRLSADEWLAAWGLSALEIELNERFPRRPEALAGLRELVAMPDAASGVALAELLLVRVHRRRTVRAKCLWESAIDPTWHGLLESWALRQVSLIES